MMGVYNINVMQHDKGSYCNGWSNCIDDTVTLTPTNNETFDYFVEELQNGDFITFGSRIPVTVGIRRPILH